MASALMYGCGYAVIERNQRGYPERLVPVDYYDVDIKQADGERLYVIRDYGAVTQDNILEISNMNRMSPIRLHRENMGLAKAAQDFGSEYFGQKGQMTGVLASDQPLRKEQMDVIQNSWNQSAMNAGTKLLPFGFKYQRITITPDERHSLLRLASFRQRRFVASTAYRRHWCSCRRRRRLTTLSSKTCSLRVTQLAHGPSASSRRLTASSFCHSSAQISTASSA